MKRVWLIAFAILITACETVPPIEFGFDDFEPVTAEVTYPSTLPKISPLQCYPTESDCKVVGYKLSSDIDKLEAYQVLADSNTDIAALNAKALELAIQQSAELVIAGKANENLWKIREEQLIRERRLRQQDKWYYRILLLGAVVVGAVSAN